MRTLFRRTFILVFSLLLQAPSLPGTIAYAQEATNSAERAASPSAQGQTATATASAQPDTATTSPEPQNPFADTVPFNPSQTTPQQTLSSLLAASLGTSQPQDSALVRQPAVIQKLLKHTFKANESIGVTVSNAKAQDVKVSLTDWEGRTIDTILINKQTIDTQTAITVNPPLFGFKPGKYTLYITDSDGTTSTQDFTWGVLAMNTNKSIYTPNETAKIAMAVLDETGAMVCNASVKVQVQNAKLHSNDVLSTDNGKIIVNPQCQSHVFSLTPDYEASYQLAGTGTYDVTVTATTKNGTYSIDDSIQVVEAVPFDVERTTATRIYPPNQYPVIFHITANQDFSGTVTEYAPANFDISPYASGSAESYTSSSLVEPSVNVEQAFGVPFVSLAKPFSGTFPLEQGFGAKMTDPQEAPYYAQFGLAGHDGLDFGLPSGTPVLATDDGTVSLAGDGAYGTTVVIDHPWGRSYYGHLSKLEVKVGYKVTKGQEIALSGNSGHTTGPHLHFGIKPKNPDMANGYYGKVDPLPFFTSANTQTAPAPADITPLANTAVLGVSTTRFGDTAVKVIKWNVSARKGDTIGLAYAYKAPNISPQFYTLGPLTFIQQDNTLAFQEARQWQIASDETGSGQSTGNGVVIATIPAPVLSLTMEKVGGSDAHVVVINSPNKLPSYKWQFLTGGLRLFIDRKDGAGWVQFISQVQTAPEYMKQQGAAGNFVWNSYGLSVNTSGINVLQGFDRQDQPDGSVKLVRTYATTEEGTAETLTETWTIPADVQDFIVKGPKVTYSMTKNRGIMLNKGVQEGTWRMRWQLSGIADISADRSDIKDQDNWPVRRKTYGNGAFAIDVNDFDNTQTVPNFTFSELAAGKRAEVLFYPDGTTGARTIDPTIITSNIGTGWFHNKQRNIIFSCANANLFKNCNFFVFYTKGDNKIYYKAGPNMTALANAAETSLITMGGNIEWDIFMVNDTKFVIAYADTTTTVKVQTCTISGATADCTTLKASAAANPGSTISTITLTRTPSADRVWLLAHGTSNLFIYSANQTGDSGTSSASNITSWTQETSAGFSVGDTAVIPFHSSDKILWIEAQDRGGTGSDGIDSEVATRGAGSPTTDLFVINVDWATLGSSHQGNGFWLSDTDFRYIYVDNSATTNLKEATFNGSSWSNLATIDSGGGQKNPAIFRDTQSGDEYAFYADSSSPAKIQRYYKPSGGSWGSKTEVDTSADSTAHSLPVTQMDDPPYGNSNNTESRIKPRDVPFCYLNADGANFDVVCSDQELAPGLDQLMRHGKWFGTNSQGVIVEQPFAF